MCSRDDVEILIATYNGEKYIEEQLNSLVGQTFQNWKAVILDDHSQDSTVEKAKSFQKRFPDKFAVRQNRVGNGNGKATFFQLLSDSEAPYVMFCDQDDFWNRDKVELTYLAMQNAEQSYGRDCPILIYTDLSVVDENLRLVDRSFLKYSHLDGDKTKLNNLLIQNTVTGCTMMANRALLGRVKCLDASKVIMHDWWMGLVASAFGKIVFIDRATLLYRQHGHNTVGAKKYKSFRTLMKRIGNISDARRSMHDTVGQATGFLETFGSELDRPNRKMLVSYANLYSIPLLMRWRVFFKYRIVKQGIMRKIGQFLYS